MEQRIKKIFIIFVVSKLFLISLMGFIFFKNYKLVDEARATFKKVRFLELKIAGYDQTKKEEPFIDEKSKELKEKFTEKESPVDFIELLEKAAEESGVELKITYEDNKEQRRAEQIEGAGGAEKEGKAVARKGGEEVEGEADTLFFLLDVKGNEKNFLDFLIKLENLKKFLKIRKLDFKKEQIEIPNKTGDGSVPPEKIEIVSGKILISL